jgi:plasmid stabilization system protein ParE
MKRYRVKITDKALADMAEIYGYIAENLKAPDAAMKQYDRIADGIESLNEFPERCKLFESRPERDLGLRQLFVDNYSAIYAWNGDCVTVLRVLYGASDIIARLRDG